MIGLNSIFDFRFGIVFKRFFKLYFCFYVKFISWLLLFLEFYIFAILYFSLDFNILSFISERC